MTVLERDEPPPTESVEPLLFPRSIFDEMITHALETAPQECCGLLGGKGRSVRSLYRLRNADASEVRYDADPGDLIHAVRSIREGGSEIVAIYHSHPRWPAVPSRTDLRENHWGDVPRPIISLLGEKPSMRVWRLAPDSYEELPWHIVDDATLD